MKDVADLVVTQHRIYGSGVLPIWLLASQFGVDLLGDQLKFRQVTVEGGEILGSAGVVAIPKGDDGDERKAVPVRVLSLNERKIALIIDGNSSDANQAFAVIRSLMIEVDQGGRFEAASPEVFTQETSCTATLRFPWTALLPEGAATLVQGDLVEAVAEEGAPARINGVGFAVRFAFTVDERRSDLGISLADKQFLVEPKLNTRLSDRRYFTTSPTDSETHLRLLRKLERALS